MEADLREALGRDEFRLQFQPIVEIETGRVYGFEALLRWHHAKRRILLPQDFLPMAEQTGLIIPIGQWVLREACRHARHWQNAVPGAGPVRISVNVSAKQLADSSLVDDVRAVLQDTGLAPVALSLEVPESVLMGSVDSSIAALHRLRELGIQLHMDDFGAGQSSLSDLPRFPLQGIKVDRTFVHRMGARRTDLEIVRSIVDLAESLDLTVTAEGSRRRRSASASSRSDASSGRGSCSRRRSNPKPPGHCSPNSGSQTQGRVKTQGSGPES